jgi:hypothetical protein
LNGTADTTEEAPGYLVFAGTGTDVIVMEVRAVFEFKTSVGSANTPMETKLLTEIRDLRRQAVVDAEKKALLRVLAPSTAKP